MSAANRLPVQNMPHSCAAMPGQTAENDSYTICFAAQREACSIKVAKAAMQSQIMELLPDSQV